MVTKQVNEKLRCSKCKKDGLATWEPRVSQSSKNRKLVGLTAGFKSIDKGGRDGPIVTCGTCGARIAPL